MQGEDIKRKKLNYLMCNQGDLHQDEQLNYILVDSKTPQSVLMCPVCKSVTAENKQKIMPLKIFLSEISGYLQNKTHNFSPEAILIQADQIHEKILSGLRDGVQKMAVQIKELEDQINDTHKHIRARLLDLCYTSLNFPDLFQGIVNNKYEDVNQMKADVFKMTENVVYLNGKIEIDFQPQKIVDQYSKILNEFTQALNIFNSSFKTSLIKVSKVLEKIAHVKVTNSTPACQFSQTLKSPTIAIEGKFIYQKVDQTYDKRFALIEPPLDLAKKSRFAVKIITLVNWVGLGICFQKILKGKKYYFNEIISYVFDYNNLGHGCYMISSNGYSWSNTEKKDNVVQQSFEFVQGDIIVWEFDPQKRIIQFQKKSSENDKKQFSLQVEVLESNDIYACVNLCNQNERVELVMNEANDVEF